MESKIETLNETDYEISEDGTKTTTFQGRHKRERNLYKLQDEHRPKLKKFLDLLGYDIIKEWRESDGWGSFQIDYFLITDRRNETIMKITGSDDNTAIYQVYKSGGKGLWLKIPDTISWIIAEMKAKQKAK